MQPSAHRSTYSESSLGPVSKPARSAAGIRPLLSACSISARWQKMYWSGIWMEKARCDRIRSTVPRTSTVNVSSRREIQMSSVQNVPVHTNVGCVFLYFFVVFGNVSLGFKAPKALCHTRIYCTRLRNGKDGMDGESATMFSDRGHDAHRHIDVPVNFAKL